MKRKEKWMLEIPELITTIKPNGVKAHERIDLNIFYKLRHIYPKVICP